MQPLMTPWDFFSINCTCEKYIPLPWKDKKGWDKIVKEEIKNTWIAFVDYLRELRFVRVKRFCLIVLTWE